MQQMKKLIVMTTISVGIIFLDCALPVLVILMMFNIKETAYVYIVVISSTAGYNQSR